MISLQDVKQLAVYFLSKAGGVLSGSVTPDTTEVYDLGATTKKWNNIYAKNVVADSLTGSLTNADTVDTFHASSTPTAGYLLALDGTSKFPIGALPNADAQYKVLISGVSPYAPAYTALSTFAGAGLSWGTGVFDIGAGTLITVGADSVGLSNGTAQYQVPVTGESPYTPSYTLLSSFAGDGITWSTNVYSIELSATSGLSLTGTTPAKTLEIADTIAGSGLTIASKVLSVGAGTLITVGADTVGVSNGTAQYQIPVTGANPYTPVWTLLSTYAGAGLTFTGGVFAVGAGNGITVNADDVALTTPGTLTVSTTNSASGSHTHAITSSSNPGATASILASTAAGYLQLVRLGVGVSPSYSLHVQSTTEQMHLAYDASNYVSFTISSGGNLTVAPTGDFIFDPVGNDVLPNTTYDLNLGAINKKYLTLHAAELWVETLVAQNTIATIGGRILVGPTTTFTADLSNTAPNQASAAYRSVSTSNTGTGTATSVVLTKPSGQVGGDILLVAITVNNTARTITTPDTTWTLLMSASHTSGGVKTSVYYKVSGGSEPANYTFTVDVACRIDGVIMAVSGCDVFSPIDQYGAQENASSSTCTAPSITTSTANTLLVFIGSVAGNRTFGTVSGMTERSDQATTSGTADIGQATDTVAFAGPGATGTKSSTMSGANVNIGMLVALKRTPVTATISVKHNQMDAGDIAYAEAAGSVEFFGVISGPVGASSPYTYEVSRNLDGSGINSWNAGDAIFNTGVAGDGFIDLYSYSSVKGVTQVGPTIVGNVRLSSTYNAWAEHWAIGNLNGVYGYAANTYGAAFGRYDNNSSFLTIDAVNGIRFQKRASSIDTVLASWDMTGNITIGEVAASKSNVHLTAGGLQLRTNTTPHIDLQADGDVFIGTDTSVAATTNLAIFTTTQTYNSESVEVGDILIGDNTSGTAKANLFWDKSAGKMYFRGGTTPKLYIDTNGALYTGISGGVGYVRLDDNGFSISQSDSASYARIKWISNWGGTESTFATIYAYDNIEQALLISVTKDSGAPYIYLKASDGTAVGQLVITQNDIRASKPIKIVNQSSIPTGEDSNSTLYAYTDNLFVKDDLGNIANLSYNRLFPKALAAADAYPVSLLEFGQNDFTNHIADFNDSQSSTYSFGASPGGFSISAVSNQTYKSNSYRHHLSMVDNNGSGNGYLQWTDATGKSYCQIDFNYVGMTGTSGADAIISEIRMWGVQNPTSTDKYYAVRFKRKDLGTYAYWYVGTGITISAADGTQVCVGIVNGGHRYRLQITVYATPAYYADFWDIDAGIPAQLGSSAPGAGYPTIIKTLRFYLVGGSYEQINIDRIKFY